VPQAFFFTRKSLHRAALVQQMPKMQDLVSSDVEIPKISIIDNTDYNTTTANRDSNTGMNTEMQPNTNSWSLNGHVKTSILDIFILKTNMAQILPKSKLCQFKNKYKVISISLCR